MVIIVDWNYNEFNKEMLNQPTEAIPPGGGNIW